ncbi:hypothetical protein [Rhizobium flavescens]|nr:hypothetical protein [Rhizobium flavescens]
MSLFGEVRNREIVMFGLTLGIGADAAWSPTGRQDWVVSTGPF